MHRNYCWNGRHTPLFKLDTQQDDQLDLLPHRKTGTKSI